MKNSMVDYSKWDKLEYDSSSDEDRKHRRRPQVTRVENSTINVSPGGARRTQSLVEEESENGADCGTYRWSQTASDIVVTIPLPIHTRARDVDLRIDASHFGLGLLHADGAEEGASTSSSGTSAASTGTGTFESMRGEWWGGVDFVSMEDSVDWELVGDGGSAASIDGERRLRISLRKRSPIPGAVHWWAAAFKGADEIDTTTIRGRGKAGVGGREVQDAWEQAQQQFKDRVRQQQQQRHAVDTDVDVDTDADAGV